MRIIKVINGKWTLNGKTFEQLEDKEKTFMAGFVKAGNLKQKARLCHQ
jgi:hypothetical protein